MCRNPAAVTQVGCWIVLAAAGIIGLACSGPANGADGFTRYAAVALDSCTGAYGYAYNHTDPAEAEWAAIRRAGSRSRIILSTTAPYFALARTPLGAWGTGTGDTACEAREMALSNARKHGLLPSIRFCEYNGPRD